VSEEIIEPSEIIIEKNGTVKEKTSHVNPWVRFLARFLDYSLFILFLSGIRYLVKGTFSLNEQDSFIPIHFFAWIPIESLFLSTWGTTPGKFFLRTKISTSYQGKLNYMSALMRSFNVWLRGIGMGIVVVNILCLMTAYHRINLLRITSWDKEAQTLVTHYPIGNWRIILSAIVILAVFVFDFGRGLFIR